MKIALITSGQPRFTPDFITTMKQIKGFDQADIYMTLWASEWAETEQQARNKIEKVLLPNYKLAKVQVCDQPAYELPPHDIDLEPAQPENVLWWCDRRFGFWNGLKMTFDLIDQDYDAVIKFRLDGRLFEDLDVSKLDLVNNELLYQDYARAGFDNYRHCDLFVVGTKKGMEFYCSLSDHITDLIPIADPHWFYRYNGTWSNEHLVGVYHMMHNKTQVFGDFKCQINANGRSRYTDHHFHHGILPDPTEQ